MPGKKSLHIESSGQLCIYCGACVGICPLNCIYLDETRITFERRRQRAATSANNTIASQTTLPLDFIN